MSGLLLECGKTHHKETTVEELDKRTTARPQSTQTATRLIEIQIDINTWSRTYSYHVDLTRSYQVLLDGEARFK